MLVLTSRSAALFSLFLLCAACDSDGSPGAFAYGHDAPPSSQPRAEPEPEPVPEPVPEPEPEPEPVPCVQPVSPDEVVARTDHSATAVGGSALIVGGLRVHETGASPSDDVLRYDPDPGRWCALPGLDTPRLRHAALRLDPDSARGWDEERVLIAGGLTLGSESSQALGDSVILDPRTGARTLGPALVVPRHGHLAVPLHGGGALVLGGEGPDGQLSAEVEIWRPGEPAFSPAAPLPRSPEPHTSATRLPDGRILAILGCGPDRTFTYAPATDAWSPLRAPIPSDCLGLQVKALGDGRVLLSGDFGWQSACGGACDRIYDPETSAWTATGPREEVRFDHALVELPDGRVFAFGGMGYYGSYLAVEQLDPITLTWSAAAPELLSAEVDSATGVGASVLLVGGQAPYVGDPPLWTPSPLSRETSRRP